MILVTGATGNVGSELVRALAGAGQPVQALTRDDSPKEFPPGVLQAVGDLNKPESMRAALSGATAMFLYPGYQDMAATLAAASEAGVGRVVMLSGSSAASGDTGNAVSRYMIESEEAVRASGLEWTMVRSFGFMSNTVQWVPQLAAGDLARILGEVLGRDLRFEGQPDDEARAEMSAAMPAEYVAAFFDFYVTGTLDESQPQPDVRDVTGREPRTFRQWAQAHASAFRPS